MISMELFKALPELPDVPRPFADFLLHSAWTADLNDSNGIYESRNCPVSIGCTEGGMEISFKVLDSSSLTPC